MKFLRNLLAVLVGLTLFSVVGFLVLAGVIAAIGSAEQKVSVEANSVLRLDLNRPIVERTAEDPLADLGLVPGIKAPLGLLDIKAAIRYAATDDKIKGIYMDCGSVTAGYATLTEIRDELARFKESGKFVTAFSEMYSEGGYYLASVADKVVVAEESPFFEFNGISYTAIFFKGLLDKLEIEPEVYRVGEFKSAVEPFTRKDLSEENELQINSFINSVYRNLIDDIAASRGVSQDEARAIADEMRVVSARDAVEYGLVDHAAYYDQVYDSIKNRLEIEQDEKIKFVEIEDYIKAADPSVSSTNRIAVIVAAGDIVSGEGDNESVGSEKFVKAIRQARDDKNIKAIVLRINSPGGSGLASDMIWREVALTREVKPVIASMSDLAASGGYYIAMGCDTIVANPTTITGSIGVFGLMFNMQDFFSEKLGITSEAVNTGNHSDILSMMRPHSEEEEAMIQNMIEEFYESFVAKVAADRNMSVERVKEIAGGRVWTGEQALENGLVDVLGSFEDAVQIAAEKAGVEDYKLRYYPKQKTFMEQLMEGLSAEAEAKLMRARLGEYYYYMKQVENLKSRTGIQARLPHDILLR